MTPRVPLRERERLALVRTGDEQILRSLAKDRNQSVRMAVAMNPTTPTELLLSLLEDKHWSVSARAVGNLSADRRVWVAAIALGGDLVISVAQVPWLPLDMAEQLAQHPDRAIREKVATSTIHEDVLDRLADDPEPVVRSGVAHSRRVRLGTLRKLAGDPQRVVRAAVAGNHRCPENLLAGFVSDRSSGVRWVVVLAHPHRPDLMSLYVDDPDEYVRRHAQQNLERPARRFLMTDGSIVYRYENDGHDAVLGPVGITTVVHEFDDPIATETFKQREEAEAKWRALVHAAE